MQVTCKAVNDAKCLNKSTADKNTNFHFTQTTTIQHNAYWHTLQDFITQLVRNGCTDVTTI